MATDAWDLALYEGMQKADEAFQAAVIRQFGKRRAGDMRYTGSLHNPATKAAAMAYWDASHRWLNYREELRRKEEAA